MLEAVSSGGCLPRVTELEKYHFFDEEYEGIGGLGARIAALEAAL
jgi:hypothetical protein